VGPRARYHRLYDETYGVLPHTLRFGFVGSNEAGTMGRLDDEVANMTGAGSGIVTAAQ
jgi:hypothetical protein